jgi:hypothetical protein
MKPLNSHSIAELAALGTIPVLGVFLMWALWPVHGAIKTNSAGSAAVLAKAGTALDTINAPPHDDGHQIVYGTLAGIDQTTKNIGILAAQGAEQVKQSATLIQATTHNLDAVGTAVTGTMSHLNTASDQIAGVARTANGSLATLTAGVTPILTHVDAATVNAGAAIKGFLPVEAAATKSATDLDTLMAGPITTDATNVGTITYHLGNMAAVSDAKYSEFMNPPPCHNWKCHFSQGLTVANDISKFAEPAYYLHNIFTGQEIFGTVTVQQPKEKP